MISRYDELREDVNKRIDNVKNLNSQCIYYANQIGRWCKSVNNTIALENASYESQFNQVVDACKGILNDIKGNLELKLARTISGFTVENNNEKRNEITNTIHSFFNSVSEVSSIIFQYCNTIMRNENVSKEKCLIFNIKEIKLDDSASRLIDKLRNISYYCNKYTETREIVNSEIDKLYTDLFEPYKSISYEIEIVGRKMRTLKEKDVKTFKSRCKGYTINFVINNLRKLGIQKDYNFISSISDYYEHEGTGDIKELEELVEYWYDFFIQAESQGSFGISTCTVKQLNGLRVDELSKYHLKQLTPYFEVDNVVAMKYFMNASNYAKDYVGSENYAKVPNEVLALAIVKATEGGNEKYRNFLLTRQYTGLNGIIGKETYDEIFKIFSEEE